MNKYLIVLIAGLSLALSPAEKKLVHQARAELKKAQTEYSQAKSETAQAKLENEASAQHAKETEDRIAPLSAAIDASHKNEQRLGDLVQKYEPFYIQGHKWWGIGAIIAGFGILATHLLILAGAIITLCVIVWILSMLPWFSFLQIPVQIAGRFFRSLRDKILKKKS